MNKVIASFHKNSTEKIVASLSEFKGRQRIDIRLYFQEDITDPNSFVPTKKGLNMGLHNWPEFMQLVGKIDKEVTGHG